MGEKTADRIRDLYPNGSLEALARAEDAWQGSESGRRAKYLMSAYWSRMSDYYQDPVTRNLKGFKDGCELLYRLMKDAKNPKSIDKARKNLGAMVQPRSGTLLDLRALAWLASSFIAAQKKLQPKEFGVSFAISTKDVNEVYGSKLQGSAS